MVMIACLLSGDFIAAIPFSNTAFKYQVPTMYVEVQRKKWHRDLVKVLFSFFPPAQPRRRAQRCSPTHYIPTSLPTYLPT